MKKIIKNLPAIIVDALVLLFGLFALYAIGACSYALIVIEP